MSLKVRLGNKRKPAGWADIEEALYQFEDRLREAVDDPHEGKRKCESAWPVHRIHYERNRYIYDLYYKQQKITRDLYEFLVRERVVDASLISKWRKPGYEIMCSVSAIQKSGTNFGTTSICRVPMAQRGGQIMVRTACCCWWLLVHVWLTTAKRLPRPCPHRLHCTCVCACVPTAERDDRLRLVRFGRRHRRRPCVVDRPVHRVGRQEEARWQE